MIRAAYLNTLKGLEGGLKVGDIAVAGLLDCRTADRIGQVRARADIYDFDNVPVRRGDEIVGVIEDIKTKDLDSHAGDAMRLLDESMLISASRSLISFLPTISERPYRLVVGDEGISGVVTPSDVVQLPVRLLVFTLLVHLEETMKNLLDWRLGDEDEVVLNALDSTRRGAIKGLLERQRHNGLNPSALDVTGFYDKATLLFDSRIVPDRAADRELFREFRDLRNRVDHVQDYATTQAELRRFLALVAEMQRWNERLVEAVPEAARSAPFQEQRGAG